MKNQHLTLTRVKQGTDIPSLVAGATEVSTEDFSGHTITEYANPDIILFKSNTGKYWIADPSMEARDFPITRSEPCAICGKYAALTELHCISSEDWDHASFEEDGLQEEWYGPVTVLCPTHHAFVHEYVEENDANQDEMLLDLNLDELQGLEMVLWMLNQVILRDYEKLNLRIQQLEVRRPE